MTANLTINGVSYAVDLSELPSDITLNTFIRDHAQLTATKFMCLEGGCGACICVVRSKHPSNGQIRTLSVNSCLTLLYSCLNCEIITCEGIGNKKDGYHPLQKRLAQKHGSQCGFCSPGFIMNMFGFLAAKDGKVSMEEVENSFSGNICRCTGYRPILDAMKSFASDTIDKQTTGDCDIEDLNKIICTKLGKNCASNCHNTLHSWLFNDGVRWHWPKTLAEVFIALESVNDDDYMLMAGNTAHGVYRRSENIKHFIDLNSVPELKTYRIEVDKIVLGGNITLKEAMDVFQEAANTPGFSYCKELWQHFDLIANVPKRNMATLAGNISLKKAHPEFPSDVYLTFECLDVVVVVNKNATLVERMSLSEYLSRPTPKMVIMAFELKEYPRDQFIFKSYKIMPRAQNAHAIVNAAFLFQFDVDFNKIFTARICFGGIHPAFTHVTKLESFLHNSNLHLYDTNTIHEIFQILFKEIQPDNVLPDFEPEYRRKLACGLFYKFLLSTAPTNSVRKEYVSGADILRRPLSSGIQIFDTNKSKYPLNQPVEKLEAMIQCSGEAPYMNDLITKHNAVYCAFVNATVVGATIEEIDASDALKIPGVITFYSAKDIPGTNTFVDPIFDYEILEIFCSSSVKYYDQPLGVIVACSSEIANRATNKVKVIYSHWSEEVFPTLNEVLNENCSERIKNTISSDVLPSLSTLDITNDYHGSGLFEVGSMYHFQMEPQTTIAIPYEDGLKIWCSTQWMDHTQSVIAKMLNLKIGQVQLTVRRLGGAFGSKISYANQVACAASLTAHLLNRPVRFVQSIESMMSSNGKRRAAFFDYEFRINSKSKIFFLESKMYQDGGITKNETLREKFYTLCSRNCYQLNNLNYKFENNIVLTDAPSSTWCRAPTAVETISMIENIMEHIAFTTNIDPVDVRLINLKPDNKMTQLLPRFIKSTDYRGRRKEIEMFNSENRWRKRGIGIAIIEYPILRYGPFYVTVAIYHCDGTVVVSHGGTEMGQGVNTKVAQVAAYTLKLPLEFIKIVASNTINGANSFAHGGSVGSENVCFAVWKACNTLNDRLAPIKAKAKKDATWPEITHAAWLAQVNLNVNEMLKIGDIPEYKVFGIGLTEVEVDMLTGRSQIKRVDILADTGDSFNPLLDIGQIEGGFVMYLGYWLTERLIYDRQTGKLLTNRTWNYKVPGPKDIPIDFRIELLQKGTNPVGFLGAKVTGEPSCCLAVSVIFALQMAIQSSRKDAGLAREWVRLGAPTTPENILLSSGIDVNTFNLE